MSNSEDRTYTREDMARAWREGTEVAWVNTSEGWNGEYAGHYGNHNRTVSFHEANDDITNPYEEEQ